jgi:hypothetical protein
VLSASDLVSTDALAGYPDPGVAQALLPLLRDRHWGVRWAAADALAGYPDPGVAQALLPSCATATTTCGTRPPARWPDGQSRGFLLG